MEITPLSSLLSPNHPHDNSGVDIKYYPFLTKKELEEAILIMKNEKAAATDGITTE